MVGTMTGLLLQGMSHRPKLVVESEEPRLRQNVLHGWTEARVQPNPNLEKFLNDPYFEHWLA